METTARSQRVDEMPLDRLRDRATDVRRILRRARLRIGAVDGQHAVDAALDRAERLLPGLMDRTRSVPLLALRRLSAAERTALRRALHTRASGEAAPEVPGGFSSRDAAVALERLEIQESLTREVLGLLASLEAEHAVFASCC